VLPVDPVPARAQLRKHFNIFYILCLMIGNEYQLNAEDPKVDYTNIKSDIKKILYCRETAISIWIRVRF
jgi:hypothetical protein